MVGSDSGAKLLRKTFLSISSNTFTPLSHWLNMSFEELYLWGEAMQSEGEDE